MYPHRIPNEFSQHDKIGKLTMPQAMVLAVGVVLMVLSIITFDLLVALALMLPIGIITAVFMFVRINKIPLYEFLLVYVMYIGTPKLLIYRSDNMKDREEVETSIGFVEVGVVAPKEKKEEKQNKMKKKSSTNKSQNSKKGVKKK